MKIAIVYDMAYPFNIGGVELRNYEIAKRLAKKHDVHIFCVKLWTGPDIIKKEKITYHGVCRYKKLHSFDGKRTIMEPLIFALKIYSCLKKEKFDVIDMSSFPYLHCFSCFFAASKKKTPLFCTWHQFWGGYWISYKGPFIGSVGLLIEFLVTKIPCRILAVSQSTKKQLEKRFVDNKNISVIYNGVDLKMIESIKSKINCNNKKYDIIFVGRLVHQKNVGLLLDLTKQLKQKYKDIRVCIVGDGPDKSELKKKAIKLGIVNNVFFTGFIQEKREVYKLMCQSRIFVLPSTLEGFGIVVVEAQACGIPVITVDTPLNASKELIGDSGYIVKNNAFALQNKVVYLMNNPDVYLNMSKKAMLQSKRFDWNIIAKELEKEYLTVV